MLNDLFLGPGVHKIPFGYRVAHHGYLLTFWPGQDYILRLRIYMDILEL